MITAMKAMKHQKKYIELEQVIYVTCFDDELWVVYAWYGKCAAKGMNVSKTLA